ncbi:hypothetical protein LGM90_19225 [Burkholderia sp. AU28942]|uniref:hypothetical protein n=1 Tax=Burkholderia TaxID=32008 RepID=UPI0012EA4153|nr:MULTISPECIES: hypothetical protein [Burkholderia]MCA8310643.1 hypothetical protein [Burkholderia sp. AU28942]
MRALKGTTSGVLSYAKAEWYCDVLEYEIPILSLYRHGRKLLLCLWVEREHSTDRYLLFTVSDSILKEFLASEISLREVLQDAARIIVFEQGDRGRRNLRFVEFENLFDDYIPSEDSYFDPRFATDEAVRLSEEKSENYYLNIGGDWYLEDWSDVTRLYKQVYAFNHAMRNIDAPNVSGRVQPGLKNMPFRGGYSIVHLLNSMQEAIPAVSRVRVESIQYASPGHIGLKVDPQVAVDVEKMMNSLDDDDHLESVRKVYRECEKFLDDNGLRTLDSAKFNKNEFSLYDDVVQQLRQFAIEILDRTGHGGEREKLISDETALPLVKALQAYVRRIMRLQKYVDDGLITKFGGAPLSQRPQGGA